MATIILSTTIILEKDEVREYPIELETGVNTPKINAVVVAGEMEIKIEEYDDGEIDIYIQPRKK